ncbi:MAG: hypothetical protein NWE93_10855 [Candidatus Bathyarchaeota archaeon]|nr:hypothetical protein [Candidatus Bathyarchaeota archaeon]
MQIISVLLTLISIGLVVGPVGAVVVMYQDDLTGLVIPSEVEGLMNGDTSFFLNQTVTGGSQNPSELLNSFVMPQLVSADVDYTSRTFRVTVNFTNPLNYDLTLNSLNADVQTQDGQALATVSLSAPLTIVSGQTADVTVVGSWTQSGETYILNNYQQSGSVTISVVNFHIDVNGIKVDLSGPYTATVPLSASGVNFTG